MHHLRHIKHRLPTIVPTNYDVSPGNVLLNLRFSLNIEIPMKAVLGMIHMFLSFFNAVKFLCSSRCTVFHSLFLALNTAILRVYNS